jgi:type I restriction enzyme S subunit
MQELLTGKRRLPGFSGKWEKKRLGEHCRFLRNGTNSRADLNVDGPLKYLHYGDIHSCNNVYMSPKLLPSLPRSKANTLDRLQEGDLVLADASEDTIGISKSVEIVGVDSFELVAGLHTIAVRFSVGIFAPRFVGLLQHCPDFNSHLRKLAAGTKVYATNRRHVSSAEVCVPPLKEQTAIATVLLDMDTEIGSLESKLGKAREIKQGMMQELLTGKIRLIEN